MRFSTQKNSEGKIGMTTSMRAIVFLSTALLIGACGERKQPSTVDAGSVTDATPSFDASDEEICAGDSVPFAYFGACFVEAQCKLFRKCSSDFLDQEECVQFFGDAVLSRASFQILLQGVENDSIQYDPSLMRTCLDSFETLSCEEDQPVVCQQILRGTILEGRPCVIREQCEGVGARCNTPGGSSDDVCAFGSCLAPADLGERCGSSSTEFRQCADDLRCVRDSSSIDICSAGELGDPCNGSFDCHTGFFCEADICTPEVGSGNTCVSTQECPGDEQCISGTGICQLPDTLGDACNTSCLNGLFCQSGQCVPSSDQAGDPCQDDRCGSLKLRCISGVCEPKLAIGEVCTGPGDCTQGSFCNSQLCDIPGTCGVSECVALLPALAECRRDFHCESDLCIGDICAEIPVCPRPPE